MNRLFVSALLCVFLTGAGCRRELPPTYTDPKPVPFQCRSECRTSCLTGMPTWSGDPNNPETWKALGDQVIEPLVSKLETCDRFRSECVKCLVELEQASVICGDSKKCQ